MLGFCVATFTASISLIGGYVTIVLAPIQKTIDGKMDRNVFDLYAATNGARISALIETNNAAIAETLHQVHDLEAKIVSRDENTVHWAAVDALTLRVNELSEKCRVGNK